ncbi:MAG: DnaA regulatory inactivator Hda [Neisseria sp.]|nr:DnaA regulatory inactivator Hda [Neisseria sp.]
MFGQQTLFDFGDDDHEQTRFESFLGQSNAELLHVLQQQRERFVYIWGQAQSGKSHLLQAWIAQAKANGQTALYIDASKMSLPEAALDVDFLAVDQVEALNLDEQALLFEIFNLRRNREQGFLLFASEVPPIHLNMREDLRTRMAFCVVYDVKPLNDEEKIAALMDMVQAKQWAVDESVFHYLLTHWRRDMDSLLHMLAALGEYSMRMKKPITVSLLRQLLLLKQQEQYEKSSDF